MNFSNYVVGKDERKVRFGKHTIKVKSYYLTPYKAGLRIEVKQFSLTKTTEIMLLTGDDKLVLRHIYYRQVLSKPCERDIEKVISKFMYYGIGKGLIKKDELFLT